MINSSIEMEGRERVMGNVRKGVITRKRKTSVDVEAYMERIVKKYLVVLVLMLYGQTGPLKESQRKET